MKNRFDLTGRVSLVTGSSSGLGVDFAGVLAKVIEYMCPLGRPGKSGELDTTILYLASEASHIPQVK